MNLEGPEGVKCELELPLFCTGTMVRLRSTNKEMEIVIGQKLPFPPPTLSLGP